MVAYPSRWRCIVRLAPTVGAGLGRVATRPCCWGGFGASCHSPLLLGWVWGELPLALTVGVGLGRAATRPYWLPRFAWHCGFATHTRSGSSAPRTPAWAAALRLPGCLASAFTKADAMRRGMREGKELREGERGMLRSRMSVCSGGGLRLANV